MSDTEKIAELEARIENLEAFIDAELDVLALRAIARAAADRGDAVLFDLLDRESDTERTGRLMRVLRHAARQDGGGS